MAKLKTEFKLGFGDWFKIHDTIGELKIVGKPEVNKPYVAIYLSNVPVGCTQVSCWVEDEDLELLAVNILKTINPKRLK